MIVSSFFNYFGSLSDDLLTDGVQSASTKLFMNHDRCCKVEQYHETESHMLVAGHLPFPGLFGR